ncbi:hypothetical protein ACFFIX_02605 [Metabacillus herbersteinensis]|uniref:Uncharacterized protein n=1 Tax=Metabacillus herbersteinensis TaxID=283816 RepID=A0ABV6G9J6_9BACI
MHEIVNGLNSFKHVQLGFYFCRDWE